MFLKSVDSMSEWDTKEIKIFKISKTGDMTNNFRRTFLDSSGETRRLILQKIDDKTISWDSKVIEFYRNGGKIHWWGEESRPKNTARNIDDLSDGSEILFLDQNNNKVYKTYLIRKNLLTGEIGAKLSQILWGNSKWDLAYCFFDLEIFDYEIAKLKTELGWKADMQVSITLSVKGTPYQKALHQKFFNNEIYRGWITQVAKIEKSDDQDLSLSTMTVFIKGGISSDEKTSIPQLNDSIAMISPHPNPSPSPSPNPNPNHNPNQTKKILRPILPVASILARLPVKKPPVTLNYKQVITAQPLSISSNYQVRVQVDGWIYLMHPEEYINKGLAVYKVGRTEEYYPDKRTKCYGEDGVPLGIWSVPLSKVRAIETELKNTFKNMIAPTKGTEYFCLPARKMLEIINEYVASIKDIISYEERGNFILNPNENTWIKALQ